MITCESVMFDGPDMDSVHRTYTCNKEATTLAIFVGYDDGEFSEPEHRMVLCPEHYNEACMEMTPTEREDVTFYMFFGDYDAPYSEVMMHMGLAGTKINTYALGSNAAQIVVRSEDGDDWIDKSGPVTLGEAGIRKQVYDRFARAVADGEVDGEVDE